MHWQVVARQQLTPSGWDLLHDLLDFVGVGWCFTSFQTALTTDPFAVVAIPQIVGAASGHVRLCTCRQVALGLDYGQRPRLRPDRGHACACLCALAVCAGRCI